MTISRLLIAFSLFLASAFALAIGFMSLTLENVKIESPRYNQIISAKDLVADILPPPMFVIEAYLATIEAMQSPEAVEANRTRLAELRQQFDDRIAHWRQTDLPSDVKDLIFNDVMPASDAFWQTLEQEVLPSLSSDDRKATLSLAPRLKELYQAQKQAVERLVASSNRFLDRSQSEAHSFIKARTLIADGAGAIAFLSLVGGLFLFHRRAIAPMVTMTRFMSHMADGHFTAAVPFTDRKDEVGQMAAAVEFFRQSCLANQKLEAEARANRQRADAERIEMQRLAEQAAQERLEIATVGLAAGLKTLASGDLTIHLHDPFSEEFEPLRHDFNVSVKQLSAAFADITRAVSAMDNGSREIAQSASDLSRRTEQQAAALEQTAAAMDEITENIALAAKRTQDAKFVANRANDAAKTSATVVGNAEDAMRKIESSSQQISSIIGVIDEIAFQTNLLALNAGVEAARAGEAGKGFAVVAQEVRELAQRAGKAAKEISALILSSSSEVDEGVKLVRETGLVLEAIGRDIVEINSHVEGIAMSAREQSTGLMEVNAAMNSMDQTTQQNAAMVEQTTAAVGALSGEASFLQQLVSAFKLEEHKTSAGRFNRATSRAA
jgi:methyl-accepting chemotaxis protein